MEQSHTAGTRSPSQTRAPNHSNRKGRPSVAMLAITGGKGGCGKTTTALGLAGALARRGYSPLVVDGDCDMPDVHHRVNVVRNSLHHRDRTHERQRLRTGGIDELARGARLHSVTVDATGMPGVSVVTGGRRESLGTALRRVGRWDGPVLVDCGAGTHEDSVRPLRYAESALVVSTDQPQCVEDSERTRSIVRQFSTALVGVVIRKTTETVGTVPDDWTVLGKLPLVDNPLASQHLQDEFEHLSHSIYSASGKVDEPYTNSHNVISDRVRRTRNQQQNLRRNI